MLGNLVKGLAKLSEDQLAVALAMVERLWGDNGDFWFEALKKFLRKENPFESVLKLIGEITLPATEEKFITRNSFKLKRDGGLYSDRSSDTLQKVKEGLFNTFSKN